MNREKFCGTLLSEEENTRAKREWGIAMLRIIIADDEFDIVELCRALITYPGAEIVGEACNGIELLKKIEELHPDVVITDICMPGMTGLELIERAK